MPKDWQIRQEILDGYGSPAYTHKGLAEFSSRTIEFEQPVRRFFAAVETAQIPTFYERRADTMNGQTKLISLSLVGVLAAHLLSLPAAALQLSGNLGIHDPSTIHKEGNRYYTFATGFPASPINMKYSDNFTAWQAGPNGAVFPSIPSWAFTEVTDNGEDGIPDNMWAPDVFYFNNQYRMYYSVSTFGSQNSVIGLATNTTLDFNNPAYDWVDQQLVIESELGSQWNAIDPGIFFDDDTQRMWMTWGSFWDGIFITELDPDTGKRITPNSQTFRLADRSSIEAPYMVKHDGNYYLFVNHGSCCQGVNSTYRIRVGRSASPTGPFIDRSGANMLTGSGELFLGTEGDVIGPGHFSSFAEDGTNYFGFHFYNGASGGAATYAIREYIWTEDGWPQALPEEPLPPVGDYNGNFVVDAADYVIWRDTLGSTTDLRANGSNVGRSANKIDQLDYLVWRSNFGDTAAGGSGASSLMGSAGTIPEPSSVYLAATLAAFLFQRRRLRYLRC